MDFDTSAFRDRAELNRTIRVFFDSRGFLETDVPVLAENPIPESHIELFRTDRLHSDAFRSPLYLLPSPEMWMKRLLAAGAPSLFQIGHCFRNGEQMDRWHRLEFSMLEWYALDADSDSNISLAEELLGSLAGGMTRTAPRDVTGPIRRMTMEEAFREFAGFSLEADLRNAGLAVSRPGAPDFPTALEQARRTLEARLAERNLPAGEDDGADDLFHRIFLTLVEDRLPSEQPLALTHWPRLVPTLARGIPGTPWADRWELYIRGVEVANCYGEENNREALEHYWTEESELKKSAGIPVETAGDWPRTIAGGMPPCSGTAVGLDRLLAIIREEESLEGLDLFPIHDMIRR